MMRKAPIYEHLVVRRTAAAEHEPLHLMHARRDLGTCEIRGPGTHPRISQWLTQLRARWSDDETPWCGVAVGGWLDECGIPVPAHFYRALAWLSWGTPVDTPRLGAIAIIERAGGGGHVGLVTGRTENCDYLRLLGGNQGNEVSEAWFPAGRIRGYRVPTGMRLPIAPICRLGEISATER